MRHILHFGEKRECYLAGAFGLRQDLAVVDSTPRSLRGSKQPLSWDQAYLGLTIPYPPSLQTQAPFKKRVVHSPLLQMHQ